MRKSIQMHRGFTLIELMISIALVLILLLGINTVFSVSSDAIGAGQQLSTMQRDIQAAQATLQEDFRNAVKDAPLFIIASYLPTSDDGGGPAFINASVKRADLDQKAATVDINGDGVEGDGTTPYEIDPGTMFRGYHRADRIIFPVRGLYRRMTGDGGNFISPTSSNEALISIGHLELPDNVTPTNTGPGGAYASDWVLGRFCLLLKDPATISGEDYYRRQVPNGASAGLVSVGYGTAAGDGSQIQTARYDLAGITLDQLRSDIATWEQAQGNSNWWRAMVFQGNITTGNDFRFACNPYVSRPMKSADMAAAAPYFVKGVSQFMVEFAGDYLIQDNNRFIKDASGNDTTTLNSNYGNAISAGNDGKVDYIVDRDAGGVERVRWYGYPRDANGDGIVKGSYYPLRASPAKLKPEDLPDVLPVWEIYNALRLNGQNPVMPANGPSEVKLTGDGTGSGRAVYEDVTNPSFSMVRPGQYCGRYTAVWKNAAPAMVRILMRLDDPSGRVPNGQWAEMTFDLR